MQTIPDNVSNIATPGDNILLLCSTFTADETGACTDLLTLHDPSQAAVLWIPFTRSPEDCLSDWTQSIDSHPEDTAIVNVDVDLRSTIADSPDTPETPRFDTTINHVASPNDLTTLGVRITNRLDEWAADEPDQQILACFDSVTVLLQYVSLQQTSQFLQAVTEQVAETEAIAHYHLDSSTCDEETIETLVGLFDIVVDYSNGAWSIWPRDT